MKNKVGVWVFVLVVLAIVKTTNVFGSQQVAYEPPVRVLFVGNSYMYYNDSLHNHVKRIVAELRPNIANRLVYKSATIGGAKLSHHNISWLLDHNLIGVDKPFEAVIMQGRSSEALRPQEQTNYSNTVKRYSELIRQSGARPLLYMTPAYVSPHTLASPSLIEVISNTITKVAGEAKIPVVPVGLAFDEAYKRNPDLSLHKEFDGSHPNLYGTYLAACVVYLSLYGGSIENLSYDYYQAIEPDVAKFLRGVAMEVVNKSPLTAK